MSCFNVWVIDDSILATGIVPAVRPTSITSEGVVETEERGYYPQGVWFTDPRAAVDAARAYVDQRIDHLAEQLKALKALALTAQDPNDLPDQQPPTDH